MKNLLTPVFILLAACGGPIGPVPPEAVQKDVPVATETVAIPEPPQPAPELAPEGTWFLTERIAVTTSQSVQAFPAGTMVREVAPGLYDIQGEFQELEPRQVTNNLDKVSNLLAQQRAQEWARYQARLRASQPQQPAPPVVAEEAPPVAPAQPLAVTAEVQPPAPVPQPVREALPIAAMTPAQPALGAPGLAGAQGAAGLGANLPQPEATPEEKVATRSFETSSGMRYHVRVRGAEVED